MLVSVVHEGSMTNPCQVPSLVSQLTWGHWALLRNLNRDTLASESGNICCLAFPCEILEDWSFTLAA